MSNGRYTNKAGNFHLSTEDTALLQIDLNKHVYHIVYIYIYLLRSYLCNMETQQIGWVYINL